MNWYTKYRQAKRLKLSYAVDQTAQVARVIANKPERYWTKEEAQQVDALCNHFRVNLKLTVLVEDA